MASQGNTQILVNSENGVMELQNPRLPNKYRAELGCRVIYDYLARFFLHILLLINGRVVIGLIEFLSVLDASFGSQQ